jgi:uncharacterized protein
MVGGLRSEWWARSDQNAGRLQIGIGGRLTSEFAGGLVEHLVKLNDKVEAGQKVAIQRNSFGEVVAEYTSSVAGEVTGQRSDAMSEPGNPLAFILFHKATPDGGETYPE